MGCRKRSQSATFLGDREINVMHLRCRDTVKGQPFKLRDRDADRIGKFCRGRQQGKTGGAQFFDMRLAIGKTFGDATTEEYDVVCLPLGDGVLVGLFPCRSLFLFLPFEFSTLLASCLLYTSPSPRDS